MGNLRFSEWRHLPVSLSELCINTTLRCGQSFRWRKSAPDEWSCALHGRVLTLKQDPTNLYYRVAFPAAETPQHGGHDLPTPPPSSPASPSSDVPLADDSAAFLHHYLNLASNLTKLYARWSAADANFRRRAPSFTGIRILRQDPWEALCGFICSSNNNISRISQMMHKLCLHYGPLIAHLEQSDPQVKVSMDDTETKISIQPESPELVPYHDFPIPETLTGPGVEAHLRELGFGYRAKYIYQTACAIVNNKGGLPWLESLVNPDALPGAVDKWSGAEDLPAGGREGYRHAHESLLELQGVGPKVADCVCLMGLGWTEAVPVDTHVWQIAQRDYNFRAKGAGKAGSSTLTKVTYDAVGDKFRALWGKEAGWAHSVLFTADLRAFSSKTESLATAATVALDATVDRAIPAKAIKIEPRDVTLKRAAVVKDDDMVSLVKRRRSKKIGY